MNTLHVETCGSGEPLLLIHGWGMHGGIWGSVVPQLTQRFRVHCVDLPGHGYSRGQRTEDITSDLAGVLCQPSRMASSSIRGQKKGHERLLDSIVDQLSAQFSEPLNLCGWSLGGQVALRWAMLAPEQVQRLVLVSSTPCFAEREDWLFGMAQTTLQQFCTELERDCTATLHRFLALQVRGSENERGLLPALRERLFSRSEPDMAALRGGLEILRDTDLRGELPFIRQPVLVISGERDKLTPPEAAYYMARVLPHAQVKEIACAAHTPFLSHPQIFLQHINEFLA